MANTLHSTLENLIGNLALLQAVDKNRFLSNEIGLTTIEDILSELEKPGHDPGNSIQYATFSEDIQEIADLEPGMVREDVVTEVTNFGAFIDVDLFPFNFQLIKRIIFSHIIWEEKILFSSKRSRELKRIIIL